MLNNEMKYSFTSLDFHAIIEMSFHQIYKVSSRYRSIITIKNNSEHAFLKVRIVFDFDFHIHRRSPFQKRHVLIFFWNFIREAINHILFNTAFNPMPHEDLSCSQSQGYK
ncbi:hypothetical protein HanLR1_Chr17g0661721 [Helianthus annuus]|nr:hypothetical protein HanHA89_Chr17g0703001 [Helianthus annuus]KAJ0632141.1 hypothetical protein HanLR1_Chr17g0661721 [Helianthus annuus]